MRRNKSKVQTIMFDNKLWTASQARSWLDKNGFIAPKLHKTTNFHRFRQVDPSKFKKGSFRTISFGDGDEGIKAVIGTPLKRNPSPIAGLKTTMVPPEKVRLDGFSKYKTRKVYELLVPALKAIERMAHHKLVFPSPVFAMTKSEIDEGRVFIDDGHPTGAGHGVFYPDYNIAKVNPNMSSDDILANVIHEYLHFVFPKATEHDVDDMTGEVTFEILGYENFGSPPV